MSTETTTEAPESTSPPAASDTPPQPSDQGSDTPPDWRASLPEDIRESEALASFGGVGDLAKSYIKTKSLVGANVVKLPGKNAEDSEIDGFFASIGRPESPEGYELPTEGLAAEISAEDRTALADIAHRSGLNQVQAARLTRAYTEFVKGMYDEMGTKAESEQKENIQTLKTEFGAAFEEKMQLATTAINKYGGEKLAEKLKAVGLHTDPDIIRAFSMVGRDYASDDIHGQGKRGFAMSPGEAKARKEAFQGDGDKMKALYDKNHPQHAAAKREWDELFAAMYPEDRQ